MKNKLELIAVLVFIWTLFSVCASGVVADENNCDKTYPINYIFYSKLFCEIK